MLQPRRSSWQSFPRRICVGLMLVSYLLTVTGFPVYASPRKHGSYPFPCQDHDCGCSSAEQCWTNCCCFTPEQHLTWAKENNVQPPAYACLSSHDTETESPACAHCSELKGHDAADAPDCDHHATDGGDHCCQKHQESIGTDAKKVHWLVSVNVLGCRGLSTTWVASGSVAPPPWPTVWVALSPVAGQIDEERTSPPSQKTPPVDPPPRRVKPV